MPPADTDIIVTSGDGTVQDIVQWFERDGRIIWQSGGRASSGVLPETFSPEYWTPLPGFVRDRVFINPRHWWDVIVSELTKITP